MRYVTRQTAGTAGACLLGLTILIHPGHAAPATPGDAAPAVVEAQRRTAVTAARGGDLPGGLAQLEALHAAHPEHTATRLDLAVVAGWAGRDHRTLALLAPLDPVSLPNYVLESYAKAARNLQRWDQALSLYHLLEARQPARPDAALAGVLVLADAERFAEAESRLTEIRAGLTPPLPGRYHFADGYLHERQGRRTLALAAYQRAQRAAPADHDVRRRRILTAAALGAPGSALKEARQHPGLLTPAEQVRLELDQAAQHVRLAALPPESEAREHAHRALAIHARLRREAAPELLSPGSSLGRALAFDQVAALSAAGRHAEAVAAFDALLKSGGMETVPGYVLSAAGASSLHLKQPKRAEQLLEAALADAPADPTLQTELFYAYADQGDYASAHDLVSQMLASEPPWHNPVPGVWLANPRHALARELQALELAFSDRYGEALAHFEEMLSLGPANTSARASRAELYRWRGWYQRAASDLARLRVSEADNPRVLATTGELALDTRDYALAEAAVSRAVAQSPDGAVTLALARRWRLHNRPELLLEASGGRSQGGPFDGRDWSARAQYFTAPFAHHYRAYLHDRYRYGRFDEGVGRDHRLGAGVEYRGPRVTARAELNTGMAQNDGAGAAAGARLEVNDHFWVEAALAANAADAPLRAVRLGIEADSVELSAGYRWHESREAAVTGGIMDFDDGNQRRWSQATLRQQFQLTPRHRLITGARAYASHNSDAGRPYFNPASDRELAVSLTHEWRLFRHYDRSLVQRLGVEAGDYWQEDFGSGSVWTFQGEHVWSLGPRTRLRYGVSSGGRIYDGQREHLLSGFLGLEHTL